MSTFMLSLTEDGMPYNYHIFLARKQERKGQIILGIGIFCIFCGLGMMIEEEGPRSEAVFYWGVVVLSIGGLMLVVGTVYLVKAFVRKKQLKKEQVEQELRNQDLKIEEVIKKREQQMKLKKTPRDQWKEMEMEQIELENEDVKELGQMKQKEQRMKLKTTEQRKQKREQRRRKSAKMELLKEDEREQTAPPQDAKPKHVDEHKVQQLEEKSLVGMEKTYLQKQLEQRGRHEELVGEHKGPERKQKQFKQRMELEIEHLKQLRELEMEQKEQEWNLEMEQIKQRREMEMEQKGHQRMLHVEHVDQLMELEIKQANQLKRLEIEQKEQRRKMELDHMEQLMMLEMEQILCQRREHGMWQKEQNKGEAVGKKTDFKMVQVEKQNPEKDLIRDTEEQKILEMLQADERVDEKDLKMAPTDEMVLEQRKQEKINMETVTIDVIDVSDLDKKKKIVITLTPPPSDHGECVPLHTDESPVLTNEVMIMQ